MFQANPLHHLQTVIDVPGQSSSPPTDSNRCSRPILFTTYSTVIDVPGQSSSPPTEQAWGVRACRVVLRCRSVFDRLSIWLRNRVNNFVFSRMSCKTNFVFRGPTLLKWSKNSGKSTQLEEKAQKLNKRVQKSFEK